MKLTTLSLSIMVALGVVACGGSDNNTPPPADPPAPQPELKKPEPQPQPEARNDDKIVDPTGTKVVDGRDLSKESTVGGLQYIRRDLEREADKAVRAQFTGGLETEPLTPDGKPQATPSLQVSNFENVDILAGSFKQVGSAVFTDANNHLDPVTHDINTHIQNNIDKDGFLRAPLTFKNDPNGVDHYFFRGVNATSIEQMGALPSNAIFQYSGHALMYGINNSYHGITGEIKDDKRDLPNAFAFNYVANGGDVKMGLGNFVDATFDVGQKKVTGDVYNAWLQDLKKPDVVKDKLVHFSGDVVGNTVLGTADRTYIPGNDEATFRAAFFGKEAEEMGGSFNSVKADDKYGSAYETGDWGGVFGATKTGGSGNNTFQGDDSNNVYGNTSVAPANNYNE